MAKLLEPLQNVGPDKSDLAFKTVADWTVFRRCLRRGRAKWRVLELIVAIDGVALKLRKPSVVTLRMVFLKSMKSPSDQKSNDQRYVN